MDKQLLTYAALMLFGTFISSVAQVMLKKAAQKQYASFWKEYLNVRVIAAYAIFFAASLLAVFAYRVVPLSMGAILEATGYIYITLFSVLIFHEKIGAKKILALLMIVCGIVVYALF